MQHKYHGLTDRSEVKGLAFNYKDWTHIMEEICND